MDGFGARRIRARPVHLSLLDGRTHSRSANDRSRCRASLNRLVTNQLADLVGFDTTRVIALPDGRNVWTVQDAFLAPTPGARQSSLRPPTGFAHNALIVQQGTCFTTVHGPITPGSHCSVADASYVGGDLTATCSRWYWPMSGGLDHLGRLVVFYVEMLNERGSGAAATAHPVATWVARFNSATFDILSFAPAPASAADIVYGAAVESDASFSYLFGWSYDQFNLPDPTSPPPSQMFVGRVPRGRFDVQPTYWNGVDWVANRAAAVPISISPDGAANPGSRQVPLGAISRLRWQFPRPQTRCGRGNTPQMAQVAPNQVLKFSKYRLGVGPRWPWYFEPRAPLP